MDEETKAKIAGKNFYEMSFSKQRRFDYADHS
jgi:hypothetical protein